MADATSIGTRACGIEVLQLNITRLCNQRCTHCHVDASPMRDEMMSREVMDACVAVVASTPSIATVDITGGAPELHPDFKSLVERLRGLGREVIVRHNLTVTYDPHPLTGESLAWLSTYFAEQGVHLISSLPGLTTGTTDAQRGDRAHVRSIEALRALNALGYGAPGTGLELDLVHNPEGVELPEPQAVLEDRYRTELEREGVRFNRLLAMANMPIGRFGDELAESGALEGYLACVRAQRDESLLGRQLCRTTVSVAPDGRLYDCDFNQAADVPLDAAGIASVFDWDTERLVSRSIRWADHCDVCIAGEGSG